MPKPKRTTRKTGSVLKKNEDQSIMDVKNGAGLKTKMLEAEFKDKMRMSLKTMNDMKKENLDRMECTFKNLLMATPKSVLEARFDSNDDEFYKVYCKTETTMDDERDIALGTHGTVDDESENIPGTPATVKRGTIKRRSRSAVSNVKNNLKSSQKLLKVRSSSIDVYKTPKGRVRLSSFMSSKKYTVSKPKKPENSGLHVKRIMKPDEEAISTCGSPLYVVPSTVVAPHVYIPLPGGVVLNIEPKESKGPIEVPGLDPKTKKQVKILCEHLKNLF